MNSGEQHICPKPRSFISLLSLSVQTPHHFQASAASSSMASSSSSSSASTSYSRAPCDVFINHRGPDVKRTFASHLYRSLASTGLRVFLDKEELEAGQNISSQIEQAIHGASVHIAIFSANYAESIWCLDELVLMVESVKSGKIILPVFYKVEPSVLRHTVKDGAYARALLNLEQKTAPDPETGEEKPRYNSDRFKKWRGALSFAANLSGLVIQDEDDEGELLDKVVESVVKNVPKPLLKVAEYPTGLSQKLEEFETTVLQKQKTGCVEAKVVGIVGMGGVGKTTLAKEIFNLKRSDYSKSSFLFDVRETINLKSVNYLQSKLLEDLTGIKEEIASRDEGVGILEKYLSSCHALIVVDDVDDASQIEALFPISLIAILNPDSLILATSRDKHVLIGSRVLESSIYYMKGLSQSHSKELFCCYALNRRFPSQEYADLTDQFVEACDGLPLSLKVFGALVCGQSECYWEATLDELHKILPNTDIHKSLEISYKSLNLDDQQIFLDIASFFIGEKSDVAIRIWGLRGFQNLQDKCLLEVDAEKQTIIMHDHIRDLGRNIAKELGTRRLWQQSTEDIDDLLEQSSDIMPEIRGITMRDCGLPVISTAERMFGNRHISSDSWLWITMRGCKLLSCVEEVLRIFNDSRSCGISNLEFVATKDGYLERILKKAPSPNLRWLRWFKCPYSSLPSWIPMENLRVLEVTGDKLEALWQRESRPPLQLRELHIWAGTSFSKFPKSIGQLKYLEKITISLIMNSESKLKSLPEEFCELASLKHLELKCFGQMISLPNSFGRLTRLQHITLNDAESLAMLPESFGNLTQLKSLNLRSAQSLAMLPESFGNLTQLESLDLFSAQSLAMLPASFGNLTQLKSLYLFWSKCLAILPESFGNLTQLKSLDLSGCGKLTFSCTTLGNIMSLENLNISYCRNVTELPPQLEHQQSLKKLKMVGANIKKLPSWIGNLCNLEVLELGSDSMQVLPPESYLKNLKDLCLSGVTRLKYLPDHFLPALTQLERLLLSRCNIEHLPQTLLKMNNLLYLEVYDCPLLELPFKKIEEERELNFHDDDKCLFALKEITMWHTDTSEVFFPGCVCPNLQSLSLHHCKKLTQIGGLCGLSKLQRLCIINCVKLEELPNLEMLISLEILYVVGCKTLRSIPGLGQLKKLRSLKVRMCGEIVELSDAKHLMLLKTLDARDCPKLRWGEGEVEQLRQRLKAGLQLT